MSETWYRARCGSIETIQVIRTTKLFAVIESNGWNGQKRESREAFDSDWSWIRRTFDEAKACLVADLETKKANAQSRLEHAAAQLEMAKELQRPAQ
jgi:hypothetical protein